MTDYIFYHIINYKLSEGEKRMKGFNVGMKRFNVLEVVYGIDDKLKIQDAVTKKIILNKIKYDVDGNSYIVKNGVKVFTSEIY